ncbi:MAG: GMC family oxidoreductase N-terminal domain-containing protein [Acidobacteria bacterium]|nr:GMC family oxidoreductase N-terminal domain-containing protein [Acidobacteriota bacterium]
MPEMYTVNRTPLANDWNLRSPDGYDVVIIGSGYGGAIPAARLATAQWPANAKPTICILERGREWLPGQFPDSLQGGVQEARSPLNALGLYDTSFSADIGVIAGSGLGGTSLVNANCAIRPDSEVFDQSPWPQAVRTLSQNSQLTQFYDRAHATLFTAQHPDAMMLNKVKALKKGAQGITGAKFEIHDITVNFRFEGLNNWGVQQRKCINCGDCTTGCNVGAKNTLDTNYLAIAKWGGAEIFTQVEVKHLTSDPGGGYLIHYLRRESASGLAEQGTLRAKRLVVIAAGTLGTTGIMLRSRRVGLGLPDSLGAHFGGNGDFFAIAYNADQRTDTLGWGAYPNSDRALRLQPGPGQSLHPGPAIVSRVRYNTHKPLLERFKAEDFSMPLMYVDAVRTALAFIIGQDTDPNDFFDNIAEAGRRLRDFVLDSDLEKGAANHSLAYLVNGHDDHSGVIELDPLTDEARVSWPGVGNQPIFQQMNSRLLQHTKALGGTYIKNPLWGFIPFRTLVTAHPLGGCVMSDSHTTGVVNHFGQVYNAQGALHNGLYITDGATLPSSLGVNPFMTISALAEWRAEHIITELGGTPAVVGQI